MNKINILLLLSAISISSVQATLSPENAVLKVSNNSSHEIEKLRIKVLFNLMDNSQIKKSIHTKLASKNSTEVDLAKEAGIEKSNISDLVVKKVQAKGFASKFKGDSKAEAFNIIDNPVEEYKEIKESKKNKEKKQNRQVGDKIRRQLKVEEVKSN